MSHDEGELIYPQGEHRVKVKTRTSKPQTAQKKDKGRLSLTDSHVGLGLKQPLQGRSYGWNYPVGATLLWANNTIFVLWTAQRHSSPNLRSPVWGWRHSVLLVSSELVLGGESPHRAEHLCSKVQSHKPCSLSSALPSVQRWVIQVHYRPRGVRESHERGRAKPIRRGEPGRAGSSLLALR